MDDFSHSSLLRSLFLPSLPSFIILIVSGITKKVDEVLSVLKKLRV